MKHSRSARWKLIAGLLVCMLFCRSARAEEILVAAASDLNFVLLKIAERFERETGNQVKISFGSSGNFYAQIQSGAPFDVFFSADVDFPRKLEAAGLVQSGSFYEYASGKIVLWVRNESKLDLSRGLTVLEDASVRKIAIANPQHAPYGRAAVAALESTHLYDTVKSRLVFGENISQAFQLVNTGNADVGIIALSLVKAPAMEKTGRYYEISSADYPPIRQGVVALKLGAKKPTARAFVEFLKRPEIIALLREYGFEVDRQ
ncbi:MAG TPA: molybdate ABC transporter substrate-binding protein [Terriglobales bacterium]|nr:molybdate ABC transporter substrate-binding protein [Terriglobales bacterium]